MDELPPEPDPAREGIDCIRSEDGELHHPLQHRCVKSAVKYWRKLDELGFRETDDKELIDFICFKRPARNWQARSAMSHAGNISLMPHSP